MRDTFTSPAPRVPGDPPADLDWKLVFRSFLGATLFRGHTLDRPIVHPWRRS